MSKKSLSPEARLAKRHQKTERRGWVRYPSDLEVSCRLVGTNERHVWAGKVEDISAVGVGLIMNCTFRHGALLSLAPSKGTETVQSVLARVRDTTAQPGGCWLIGCSFVRELSEQELEAWL